jgi:hypothetical protein
MRGPSVGPSLLVAVISSALSIPVGAIPSLCLLMQLLAVKQDPLQRSSLLKGTSKNQEFHTYSRLQKNALRRQRI